MEKQLTVRVPEHLYDKVEQAAKRLRRSRSAVVRLALEGFLQRTREADAPPERPYEIVEDLIGSVESGVPDLGSSHREHLLSLIRERRERWRES